MQSNSAHSQSGTLAPSVHVLSLQTVTTSSSRTLVRCPFTLPVPPTRKQLRLQSSFDNRQEGWHLLQTRCVPHNQEGTSDSYRPRCASQLDEAYFVHKLHNSTCILRLR